MRGRQATAATVAVLVLASLARADEIVLINGDRLSGSIVEHSATALTLDSALLGQLEVPLDAIETVTPPLRDAPASSEPEAPAWHGELTAGFDFERGNTFKSAGDVGIEAVRESERNRIQVRAMYEGERIRNKSTGASTTTERDLTALLRNDRFRSQKFFWYTSAEGERDGPRDLELRFMGGLGLGYRWINTDALKVEGDAGLSWIHDDYKGSKRDEDSVASVVHWSVERRLPSLVSDRVTLSHRGKAWIDLEEWDDRVYTELTLGLRSDLTARTFLEFKAVWEYDAEPASNRERLDVDYIFSLGHRF